MTAMPESLADAEHGPKRRRARQEEFPERTGKPVPWSLSADLVRLAVLNWRHRPRQAPARRRTSVVPAALVDKGVRERRPHAVRLLPAVRQAPRRKPDDRGSPVWNPAPRQDREARPDHAQPRFGIRTRFIRPTSTSRAFTCRLAAAWPVPPGTQNCSGTA